MRATLPFPEWVDRKDCGNWYQIWGRISRGEVSKKEPNKTVDTFQLNPIAKAVFGVATVTFEVRARYSSKEQR